VAVALDADAIVAYLDRSDALHASAAERIGEAAAADSLVASTVTFAEVLTGARLGHHDEALVRGFFRDLVTTLIAVDERVAEAAAGLRSTANLRMPDALVLATATVGEDVVALITGDERIGRAAGGSLEVRLLRPPSTPPVHRPEQPGEHDR